MPPRKTTFGRLLEHFHEHPQGRLHEMLFWGGIGVAIGALTLWGWLVGWMSDPFVWMTALIAACFVGFALLPRHKRKHGPPPLPPGKRRAIAEQVRASKAEKKRKGPPPPGPPIRRG